MTTGQIVLVAYGLFLVLGAAMGGRAGSRASVIAGGGSAVLLFVAFAVSRFEYAVGLWLGAAVAALVCVMMGRRFAATGKVMPAGMTLAVSVVALVLLLRDVAF